MSADEDRELLTPIPPELVEEINSFVAKIQEATKSTAVVGILRDLLRPLVAKARERDRLAEDLEAAAGELLLPIPEPGTDMARLCIANRLLKAQLKQAQEARDRAVSVHCYDDAVQKLEAAIERAQHAERQLSAANDRVRELEGRLALPCTICGHVEDWERFERLLKLAKDLPARLSPSRPEASTLEPKPWGLSGHVHILPEEPKR